MSCISDLVVQLAEDLGDGANDFSEKGNEKMTLKVFATHLNFSGASIMQFLDLADSKIGRYDMRFVDGKNLISELQTFSEEAEIIDTDHNSSKQNALIRYLDKRIEKLRAAVEEEWNTALPRESKKEECDKNDWLFLKKEEEKLSYTCEEEGCSSTFNNGQSYQRHLKKKHKLKRAVKMPTVTCRLEHLSGQDAQIADHQITSHLKIVHNIEKPSDAHFFRGFIRSNGAYSPVFLLNGQPDPSDPSEPDNNAPDNVSNEDSQDIQDDNVRDVVRTPEKETSEAANSSKSISPDFHGYSTIDPNTFREVFAAQNSRSSHRDEVSLESNLLKASEKENVESVPPLLSEETDYMDEDDSNFGDEVNFVASHSDFSDIEDEDTPDYTQSRIEKRLYRYHMRRVQPESNDLCKQPGNVEFIEDFEKFVLGKNLSRNANKSNIDKSVGHIARYDDSLLNFLTKQNPNFTLSCLVAFKDKDKFVKLKDPMLDWIKEIAGESGLEMASRQKEKLKGHSDLRRYVTRRLKQTEFGNDLTEILWSQKIREQIDEITTDIQESGVFGVLNKVIEQNRQKVLIAKSLINPAQDQKEAKAIGVYFASEKFKKREIAMNKVYLDTMEKDENPGHRDFYNVGNFGRTLLALNDRCRRGAYEFSNNDYFGRQPRWYPPGANTDEFQGVPDGLLSVEPEDKRPPDMYIIKLSGETQKGGFPATITINKKSDQWLQIFRQMKGKVYGAPLDPEEPFFQNINKKPFGNLTNSKGSMLAEFSSVTGVKNFTTTSARRTLQSYIQNNELLKANTSTVSQHSQAVAVKHYDRGDADFRASTMHFIGEKEGTNAVSSNILPDSDEILAKRRKINEEDMQTAVKKAKETLESANTRNIKVGPRCKIDPDNRKYMQTIFSPGGKLENIVADGKRIKGKKIGLVLRQSILGSFCLSDQVS